VPRHRLHQEVPMTSFTDIIRGTGARATEGARRATGVALAPVPRRSPHRVRILLNQSVVHPNLQLLRRHVNARHDTLIDGLRGQPVQLSKHAQSPVASDEAHQVIATRLGLDQGVPRGLPRGGEINSGLALFQGQGQTSSHSSINCKRCRGTSRCKRCIGTHQLVVSSQWPVVNCQLPVYVRPMWGMSFRAWIP
jgi:hypothetical protein